MAINKKQASKTSGSSKAAPKAAPAKKAAAKSPVKATPAKKTAAPAAKAAKKAAPAPAKKAPVKAAAPAKKVAAPAKKAPVKAAPAKKAAPAPKAPVKKAAPAPAKKAPVKAAPAKKAAPAPAAKAKPAAPAPQPKPAAKPAPAAKVVAAPVAAPKKAVPVKEQRVKSSDKKKSVSVAQTTKILKAIVNNSSGTPVHPSKPSPAPVGRSLRDDKKPQVIVAHRRLQSEYKKTDEVTSKNTSFNEFNRSLLDEQPAAPTVAKRYSDEELNEFREIINSRLENARKELAYLQGLIMRKDSAGTEDSENRFNVEDGSGAMERETVSQLASRQIQFISNLEKALIRIENKTYGVCRVTGKLIDKARLRAVPHATLSIEAKTSMKK